MALRIQRKPGTVGKCSGDSKSKRQGTPKAFSSEQGHDYQGAFGTEVDRLTFMNTEDSNSISRDAACFRGPAGIGAQTGATAYSVIKSQDKQLHKGPPAAHVHNIRKAELNKRGIKDLDEWVKDPNNVYIGRDMTRYVSGSVGSKWGNPFKKLDRDEAVKRYEEYVRSTPELMAALDELKGKNLGCWCHPLSCHGHVLVKLLEEKIAKEQMI